MRPRKRRGFVKRTITSLETGTEYQLGELLGKGGYGSAWKCACRNMPGPLCLKLTRHQESWHREAYMAALVGGHPRVVEIYETFPTMVGKRVSYAVVM